MKRDHFTALLHEWRRVLKRSTVTLADLVALDCLLCCTRVVLIFERWRLFSTETMFVVVENLHLGRSSIVDTTLLSTRFFYAVENVRRTRNRSVLPDKRCVEWPSRTHLLVV